MHTGALTTTMPSVEASAALAAGAVSTWAGDVRVWASPAGVRRVELPAWGDDGPMPEQPPASQSAAEKVAPAAAAHLRVALEELARYFAGELRVFGSPLDPEGTPFLRAAWAAVARVPYGQTRSYGEVAADLGLPHAARAVGRANATNPIAPMVPCHRILGSDGRLTGYGPGLPLKQRLLVMEGALPEGADDYDAWVARLEARSPSQRVYLGLRATRTYCTPGCARSRRASLVPGRVFVTAEDARAAGYAPCALCGSARLFPDTVN